MSPPAFQTAFQILDVHYRASSPPGTAGDDDEESGTTSMQGRREILVGVDAEIEAGSIYAILGPSGAGKSTLLRLMNRLAEPSRGELRFDGSDLRRLDPRELRRRVGMVFQEAVRFEGSVEDNLLYGHRAGGAKALGARGTRQARSWAERIGLEAGFLTKSMADLSGGEAQRVGLARALAIGPDALLLDEPTASLDAVSRERIEAIVREEVVGRGLTVVWVTHDVAQARRVATRALLMVAGRGVCEGPVDEVLGHPDAPGAGA